MIGEKQITGGINGSGGSSPQGVTAISEETAKELLKKIEMLEKDRDMLLQVADKRQLGLYYSRHQAKIPARVMIRTMQGTDKTTEQKVILGWRTTQDEVYQDPATMRWVEKQMVELLYEDGKAEEMFLRDFNRRYKQVEAEVKKKIVDEATGNVALTVMRLDNGKEYTLSVVFVN